jgi:hypothetical protein
MRLFKVKYLAFTIVSAICLSSQLQAGDSGENGDRPYDNPWGKPQKFVNKWTKKPAEHKQAGDYANEEGQGHNLGSGTALDGLPEFDFEFPESFFAAIKSTLVTVAANTSSPPAVPAFGTSATVKTALPPVPASGSMRMSSPVRLPVKKSAPPVVPASTSGKKQCFLTSETTKNEGYEYECIYLQDADGKFVKYEINSRDNEYLTLVDGSRINFNEYESRSAWFVHHFYEKWKNLKARGHISESSFGESGYPSSDADTMPIFMSVPGGAGHFLRAFDEYGNLIKK